MAVVTRFAFAHCLTAILGACLCDALLSEDVMNGELLRLNAVAARLAWAEAVAPGSDVRGDRFRLARVRAEWRNRWCRRSLLDLRREPAEEDRREMPSRGGRLRQFYLLCRGPMYDPEEAGELTRTLGRLQDVYQSGRACLKGEGCLRGEPDLERLMSTSRDPEVLLSAWTEWRKAVGLPSKAAYVRLVEIMNAGARNNGYNDIGECWREELESGNLEELVEELYAAVKPLYVALHAVVRHRLSRYYGSGKVASDEMIPAHLLGDMWGQNWANLVDLIVDVPSSENVTRSMQRKKYTVTDMVKRAEDFYESLGFEAMPPTFWSESKLGEKGNEGSVCHASAANMFTRNDFRMIFCGQVTARDFYVAHHEMGHVHYYMEYQDQPAVFQDGVNSAFQEAVGDAVGYGVTTPAHLQRLGLIGNENESSGIDLRILLEQALAKLPEMAFALAVEKWRWGVFRGDITPNEYNSAWWALRGRYEGLKPPMPRDEQYFDPAAKFHIADNTPYIRYFLSGVLQVQIFEALCKGSVFGYDGFNKSLDMPLHRCDIYGSKEGSKRLREVMAMGSSVHWSEALAAITGEGKYSAEPLLRYYHPLHRWLAEEITKNDIPVGW